MCSTCRRRRVTVRVGVSAADGGVWINTDELLKGRVGKNSDIDFSAGSCTAGELSLQN